MMAAKDGPTQTATVPCYDLFKDAKPFYGSLIEKRDKVPTLFSTIVNNIVENEVKYDALPTVIKGKVDYFKQYSTFPGPKIIKCSQCGHFYTSEEKFIAHMCYKETH